MIDYAGIYLKKQSAEYARIILNVSDAVHSKRSLYNLLETIRVFLSKIRTSFLIFKKGRGGHPSPL